MSENNIKHSIDKVREQLIAEYKEALRHKEIKDAVHELREKYAAIKNNLESSEKVKVLRKF